MGRRCWTRSSTTAALTIAVALLIGGVPVIAQEDGGVDTTGPASGAQADSPAAQPSHGPAPSRPGASPPPAAQPDLSAADGAGAADGTSASVDTADGSPDEQQPAATDAATTDGEASDTGAVPDESSAPTTDAGSSDSGGRTAGGTAPSSAASGDRASSTTAGTGGDGSSDSGASGDGGESDAQDQQQTRHRRGLAISESIQRLKQSSIDQLSEPQKVALVGQVAQGAQVDLGALRAEMANARLKLQQLRSTAAQIKHDRDTVPRQVRTGQMSTLGASNRWDQLQEQNSELQTAIDNAFAQRLELLNEIPQAQEDLKQARSLLDSSGRAFDDAQRQQLSEAIDYLGQRRDAMQELLSVYNEQAAVATAAYEDSSKFTEELSAAIVAARKRGLLARSDAGISPETFHEIGSGALSLSNLGSAIASGYRDAGRPAQSMTGYVLRLVGSALLLAGLVVVWLKLPGWLISAFDSSKSAAPQPGTDGGEDLATMRGRREAELLTPVARAALLAAVAAVGLQLWGLPQEWVMAALAVLGTWAAYFAIVAVMRQLLAPRHEELRVVPIDTDAATALYRLLRALALWSAIILPIIWALSVLGYEQQDVLVLLSVTHVVALAIIAGWIIYAAGGPSEFVEGAKGRSAAPIRRVATVAVPAILGLSAAIAVLKAVGYVNLGSWLARILYLDLPLVILALILDWQIRKRVARGSAWHIWLRIALWAAFAAAQIWVLGLRWHHWEAITEFLKRPLFTVAETDVSAFSILRGIMVVIIAWLVAKLVRGWLTRSKRISDRLSEGVQYALSSLTFYVILVAGILWAMLVGGFPLNALTVLAGMAGIGLGFGLQDIVRNFVAGLILLLERPLAVGDYIEVAGTWGRVMSISLRSTVVRTQDNAHILVPNGDIIAQQLTNLSHQDRTLRVVIPVGVSYDSDIDAVIEILTNVAKEHPNVRDFPEPGARLASFGDSAIVVELLAWIADPGTQVGTTVDLNLEIWRALKREGIEIPFPQRDLHIRSDSAPLRIEKEWREVPEENEGSEQ